MRDTINLKQIEYDGEEISIIAINDPPIFDGEDYDLFDTNEFRKYITDIKRICRGSFEYRRMINYLRENMDMNKCSFYENVNNIDTFKIKIHIHHHPFTIEDICCIVYNKRLSHNESLEVEMVAKEVMYLHYNLLVGLIPLAETPHELVHNNYLFIPIDKVLGFFRDFVSLYEDYMSPELLDKLERNIDFTNSYNDGLQQNILQRKYVYLDITGSYKLPKYEDIIKLMDRRIQEIKNGQLQLRNPIRFVNK